MNRPKTSCQYVQITISSLTQEHVKEISNSDRVMLENRSQLFMFNVIAVNHNSHQRAVRHQSAVSHINNVLHQKLHC